MKKLLFITIALFYVSISHGQLDQSAIKLYLPFNNSLTDASGKNVSIITTAGELGYTPGKFGNAGVFVVFSF